MSFELAIMALEGLRRAPLSIIVETDEVIIEGQPGAFKDLARLCLLLGAERLNQDDAFELQTGVHVSAESRTLRLRLTTS